jgi:hypothetical protein
MSKTGFFLLALSGFSNLCQAGTPEMWGFMEREGESVCMPLHMLDKKYLTPMTLDMVMSTYSPSGYTMQQMPEHPRPEAGIPFTEPAYAPRNGKPLLMSKASCQRLEAAFVKSKQIKSTAVVPEEVWTQAGRQR